jgi:hypothetical protein
MTKPKTTTPALLSVANAERALSERKIELAAIKADIAAAEAALPALAADDDDAKFEAKSLEIDRLKRAELRASARLEQAHTAVVEAEVAERQAERRALFAEGQQAAAEIERLAGVYAEHAAAVAEILIAIDAHRAAVEDANAALPDGEYRIDAHAAEIHNRVKLPAVTDGGEDFWYNDYSGYSPLNPKPTGRQHHFNETLEHRPATPLPARTSPQQARRPDDHVTRLPNGGLVYKVPPVAWPPARESFQGI